MKATRINAKQAQGLINNEEDSKETSISYEGKTIKIKCLLSNTKACKWDKKYPENHNHYIITVSYEGKKLSFDWFDSFRNFRCGIIDKSRKEIIEMFYSYLQDILCKNELRLLYGTRYVIKKINIIESLKALIFTNLQTICKKHLIFKDLKR